MILALSLALAAPTPTVLSPAPYAVAGELGAAAIATGASVVITSGREERAAHVWAPDGRLRGEVAARGGELVTALAASDDGRLIAVGSASGLRVYDAASLSPLHDLPTDAGVQAIWLGPDATIVATRERGLLRLSLDQAAVRPTRSEPVSLTTLAASPDGTRVAGCGADHVELYDLTTDRTTVSSSWNDAEHGYCAGVTFSLDGGTLIVAGSRGTLLRWSATSGRALGGLPLPFPVQAMAGGAANAFLWVIDFEGRVRQIRSDDGREGPALPFVPQVVEPLVVAPDGRRAIVETGEGPRLVSVATLSRDALRPPGHGRAVVSVLFEPDGMIESWDRGGAWQLWSSSGAPLGRGSTGVSDTRSVARAGDRTLLAADERLVLLQEATIEADIPGRWLAAASDSATGALAGIGSDGRLALFYAGQPVPAQLENPGDGVDVAMGDGKLWALDREGMLHTWDEQTAIHLHQRSWTLAGTNALWPFIDRGTGRALLDPVPVLPDDGLPQAQPLTAGVRATGAAGIALLDTRAGLAWVDRSGFVTLLREGREPALERWYGKPGPMATVAVVSPLRDQIVVGFEDGHLELWPVPAEGEAVTGVRP